MTDVVLIHPSGVHGIYGTLGSELISCEQPLWPRLIAGALLDKGVNVKIVDAEADGLSAKRVADLVSGYAPALACIVVSGHQPSASTQAMPGAREIAEELTLNKFPGKLVMMGNHPSALPVRTLEEERVDFVIDGEGPTTILGLLDGQELRSIPGLVWKGDSGQVIQNPRAALLDVDRDLHGRAWHLLPDPSHYRSHYWQRLGDPGRRSPYAAVHTSLGCPFECSFCMINVFQHTNRYRMRDPQAVVDEIEWLYRAEGVETFKFVDELFVLNKRHTRAICEGLIGRGLGDKISSWCYARPDTVTPEDLKMFRAAGFDWFALGIESGAESVRDGADKTMSQQDIVDTVTQIEKAGINVIANYIFGLPGETPETMRRTLEFAQSLNTAFANFYTAMAYPGSKLYDEAIDRKWALPETWAGYSQHNEFTRPLAVGDLAAADILRFRDGAFNSYYSSPRYLAQVRQRFGHVAEAQIQKMTTYKLKRNLLEEARS